MAEEKKTTTRKQDEAPTQADLLSSELGTLKAEHQELQQQLRDTQLQLRALLGKSQSADEIVDYSRRVLDRLDEKKKSGGKYAWRILNRNFTDGKGNPVGHVIWSNARDAKEAVADFKRRAGVSWDVGEGRDPYDAEPVVSSDQ